MEGSVSDVDLIIPIYLDTTILLDLIASIEGGFRTVEKISTKVSNTNEKETNFDGDAGISHLVKFGFSGKKRNQISSETDSVKDYELYQTYGSLLFDLRLRLMKMGLLKSAEDVSGDLSQIRPIDFVELKGYFRPNPLNDFLLNFERLLSIFKLIRDIEKKDRISGGKKGQAITRSDSSGFKDFDKIYDFFKGIKNDQEKEGVRLFFVDSGKLNDYKAIISIHCCPK